MNKLIIDKEINLDNYVGYVEVINDCIINVKGICKIYEIVCNRDINMIINLCEDSSLEFNRFVLNPLNDGGVIVNHINNSKIVLNESIICSDKYTLNIDDKLLDSNIDSSIKIRLIADSNSNVVINANGIVNKNTINNTILEDIKCFNMDNSNININPNLIVDSNEVVANHNATIKNITEDELFYLNSKGIGSKEAIMLLRMGFALSIFKDDEFIKLIKEYL